MPTYTTTYQPNQEALETHLLAGQLVVFIDVSDEHDQIGLIPGTPVRIDIAQVENSADIVTVKGDIQTPPWLRGAVTVRLDMEAGTGTVSTALAAGV